MAHSIHSIPGSNAAPHPGQMVLQNTPFCKLPEDIFIEFFKRLALVDFAACAGLCKQWKIISEKLQPRTLSFYIPNLNVKKGEDFLSACKKQHRLNSNLNKNLFATSLLFELPTRFDILRMASSSGRLNVSVNHGGKSTIWIWDIESRKLIEKIDAGRGYHTRLYEADGKLFIGEIGGDIRIRNLESYRQIAILPGHLKGVLSIIHANGELFVLYYNDTIKKWNINSFELTGTIPINNTYAIAYIEGKLFITDEKKNIKVLNPSTLECIETLHGHNDMILFLININGKLCSYSDDYTFKFWNPTTHQCEATIMTKKGNKADINARPLTVMGETLFYSSVGTIKRLDVNTQKVTELLVGEKDIPWHGSTFNNIEMSDGKLFYLTSYQNTSRWNVNGFHMRDYAVDDETILNGIADELASQDKQITAQVERLFSQMPDYIKKQIYGNLYPLIKERLKDDCDSASQHAFHNQNGHSSSFPEKAQAIQKSLEADYSLENLRGLKNSNEPLDPFPIARWWSQNKNDVAIVPKQMLSAQSLIEQFSKMPPYIKNQVYAELYQLIKGRSKEDYPEVAEHAFHDQYGQASSFAEKVQAIRNCLAARKTNQPIHVLPKKPFLEHLGIISDQDFSDKLKCRPEHLKKIGIVAAKDLEVICSLTPHLKPLTIEQEASNETDFRDNTVKARADGRRGDISNLTDQISKLAAVKQQEVAHCGVLLYDGESPWIGFQNKLNAFQTKLTNILEECNSNPRLIVEAFKSSQYAPLAAELNALVEEFHRLDKEQQIAKLSAYVNQWGISTAWENLNEQGVFRLANLSKTLPQLLQMGE